MDLIDQRSKGKSIKLSAKAAKPSTGAEDVMQRLKDRVAQTTQIKGARSRAILPQIHAEVPKRANAGRRRTPNLLPRTVAASGSHGQPDSGHSSPTPDRLAG